MLIDKIISPFARLHYANSKRRERQMGFSLQLTELKQHWIDSTMIFDMQPVWHRFGLSAIGVNYFTIGTIQNGLSTRYDTNSPYYQAWLGGYIVQFPKPREWILDDHFALGVADQKNWLQLYGVKNPDVRVEKNSVKNVGSINIDGYKGKLYQGNIWSNTDVGNKKPFLLSYMMAGMGSLFHFDNTNVKISANAFIPRWDEKQLLNPFQLILLKGYVALFPLTPTTTALFYVNSCEFTDKNGVHHDYFSKIKDELKKAFYNIHIVNI